MADPGSYYRVEKGYVLIPEAELADLLARREAPGEKSLRDEFAVAVLPMILQGAETRSTPETVARGAYIVADAMMKARTND